jgi:hypothetical protein
MRTVATWGDQKVAGGAADRAHVEKSYLQRNSRKIKKSYLQKAHLVLRPRFGVQAHPP